MTHTVNSTSTDDRVRSAAERELRDGLDDGSLTEIEVAWSDPFGHAAGQADPGRAVPRPRARHRIRLLRGLSGLEHRRHRDRLAAADQLGRRLPRRVCGAGLLDVSTRCRGGPGVGHVISDIVAHDRSPSLLDPRAVLKKVLARLAALGYTAKIGVEFEFYLLNPDGSPFQDDIHAYSLENANALDPLLTDLYETLSAFTRLEGIQTEYGPGQIETNLVYTDALDAADDAARLKYAAKEVARKHGKIASFMPKPFTEHSGSSQHLHISLWRGDEPAFAPDDGAENELALHAIAGLLEHLPSITLVRRAFGQRLPTVHSGLVRARDGDVEPRQPQCRGAVADRARPVRHPDRVAQRRLRRQPVLADRVGPGGGRRRAGSQTQRSARHRRQPLHRGRSAA